MQTSFTMMLPFLLFTYLILLFTTVPVADLAIRNFEEGGLMHWWDRKVLFPLRLKGSKLAKPLGDCPLCFTTWLGCTVGTLYWAVVIIYLHEYWWLLVLPGVMYISIGLTAFFKMMTDKKP